MTQKEISIAKKKQIATEISSIWENVKEVIHNETDSNTTV